MKAHVTVIEKTHMAPFMTGINRAFKNSYPHKGRCPLVATGRYAIDWSPMKFGDTPPTAT